MLTKCYPMSFSWKVDVFCTINHWKSSKTRKRRSCWNLIIQMKIIFWPLKYSKNSQKWQKPQNFKNGDVLERKHWFWKLAKADNYKKLVEHQGEGLCKEHVQLGGRSDSIQEQFWSILGPPASVNSTRPAECAEALEIQDSSKKSSSIVLHGLPRAFRLARAEE